MHSTHQPSPSRSVLVHSSLCLSSTVNHAIAVSACVSCMRQEPLLIACPIGSPSPLQSVLVLFYCCTSEQKSLCRPPTSHHHRNQCLCIPVCAFHPAAIHPLQSVGVCPTSASATTVHCVFHLAQSELALSISTPVNQNRLCSPHNRQPHRNQCLWIPWCAFHYVLLFCSFCLLGNHTKAISACVSYTRIKNHSPNCALPAITGLRVLFLHQ